jgi:hypothetical protein
LYIIRDFVQRNISPNISKYLKLIQNISRNFHPKTFTITMYIMGEQLMKFIHMDEKWTFTYEFHLG